MNKVSQRANRARWEEHVRAWRSSGLTQSLYCREYGLLLKTFSAWVGRLKRESVEAATPLTMVPVVVQCAVGHNKLTSPISLQHHSGWQWQLSAEVSASWLGNVLNQLR